MRSALCRCSKSSACFKKSPISKYGLARNRTVSYITTSVSALWSGCAPAKTITLSKGKNNTAANPTRDLGLPSGATFNLAAGGRKAIKGDETAAKLAAKPKTETEKKPAEPGLFGKKWLILLLDERNEIVKFLLNTEEPDAVREKAIADWGLNEAQAVAVSNVSLVSALRQPERKKPSERYAHTCRKG